LQVLHSDAGLTATGLESPVAAEHAGGEPAARLLGDFRIIREIGRGGMGIVYEAQQVSLGRRVALKVLPFAAVLDSKQLQRFKNEAQAAAQLHHTNIVPVHAVGCERGVHYYAMQFIDGRNLADVIRELRQLNPPLPSRERAGVRVDPSRSQTRRGEETAGVRVDLPLPSRERAGVKVQLDSEAAAPSFLDPIPASQLWPDTTPVAQVRTPADPPWRASSLPTGRQDAGGTGRQDAGASAFESVPDLRVRVPSRHALSGL
jgi:hypothetical protein